jgi:hypothetical protein
MLRVVRLYRNESLNLIEAVCDRNVVLIVWEGVRMASIEVKDTIESSGFPLAFRVDRTSACVEATRSLDADQPGTIKVEARALGGHQKEAVVSEGSAGAVWRLVSDEGPMLQGTDLAPFPLGFMNAGLLADVLGRVATLAKSQCLQLGGATAELATDYAFEGSFFKGTGKGSAKAPQFKFAVPSGSQRGVAAVRNQALDQAASPNGSTGRWRSGSNLVGRVCKN